MYIAEPIDRQRTVVVEAQRERDIVLDRERREFIRAAAISVYATQLDATFQECWS